MSARCTICIHASREQIDHELVAGRQSVRAIARQWRVSKDSLARHRNHIARQIQDVQVGSQDKLLTQIQARLDELDERINAFLATAEDAAKSGSVRAMQAAAALFREARENRRDVAHLLGISEDQRGKAGGIHVAQAVIISPAQLPPGAPCELQSDPWGRELPEPIDAEVVEGPGEG